MILSELLARHDVPGAQVAVLENGEIHEQAAGVLSRRTGVEAMPDAVFKIGSITKVWTATLVHFLVRDGLLDLDEPVATHLPGLAPDITARHLLTHTSGLDANHFTDTRTIEECAAAIAAARRPFAAGVVFSYSNSGYTVLGRLVEVLRGKPFHDVLRAELVTPLRLETVATDACEAILHRAAVGHTDGVPTTRWAVSYSTAPSGSHLAMSARDLMAFVRLQLRDHAALREPQLGSVPDFGGGIRDWGLGWMLYDGGIAGHTGVSRGQKAFLRLDPANAKAVAMLTNSTNAEPLAHEVFSATLGPIAPPPVPSADRRPVDDWMCGTYRTNYQDTTLTTEHDRAYLTHRPHNGAPQRRTEVTRLGDDTIITTEPPHQVLSLLHNGAAAGRVA
ncbi:serine hydrolase domain-containing protein [Lentzea sp. NPDC060358]|uniref:serine hydrolase domain-containing protein n=1 Tax=Lentzea sp. NPDC060358 TaxID=3347103 RepID=UPI0036489459